MADDYCQRADRLANPAAPAVATWYRSDPGLVWVDLTKSQTAFTKKAFWRFAALQQLTCLLPDTLIIAPINAGTGYKAPTLITH